LDMGISLKDILEYAVQMEIKEYRFYSLLKEIVKEEKFKKFFRQLYEEEVKHRLSLEKLQDKVKENQDLLVGSPEYEVYLRALVGEDSFPYQRDNSLSLEEILKEAIELEKDSVLFFTQMKNFFPFSLEIIEGILEEEKLHLAKLSAEKLRLSS